MIELTMKLVAPACAGGGTGAHLCTAERKLSMDRSVNTPDELGRLVAAFESATDRSVDDMVAELVEEFQKAAQTPLPAKPAKKGRDDGSV